MPPRQELRRAEEISLFSDSEDDSIASHEVADLIEDILQEEPTHREDDFEFLEQRKPRGVNNSVPDSLATRPNINMPSMARTRENIQAHPNVKIREDEPLTVALCLQIMLDVLPDISVDYALHLINKDTQDDDRNRAACERVISQLLDDGAYPKESSARKRKREDEEWDVEDPERKKQVPDYFTDTLDLLKDKFSDIPVHHLRSVLEEQKSFFKACASIEEQLRDQRHGARRISRASRPRTKRRIEIMPLASGSQFPKELDAAKKKKSAKEAAKRHEAAQAEQAEEENVRQAQQHERMGECQCCFDEFSISQMTHCNGAIMHRFCPECSKRYVETEMGSGRCRPVCFADSNCGGIFSRSQLQGFLGGKSFDRLEHMQQQQELAAAGLDFLSECPFCDFKAECPPVEVDKEFRCMNPKCKKVSCRHCNKETHIPLSCAEVKANEKITIRHVVEEAMSTALIRYCNRCKNPFVKEHGCNKMTCSRCRNVQCYVCSKNVVDYRHFQQTALDLHEGGKCPLHENVEARHEKEVKEAAEAAMAKIRDENPNIAEADLMIQVSNRVKDTENARKDRARIVHNHPYYQMANEPVIRYPAAGARPAGPLLAQVPGPAPYEPPPFANWNMYRTQVEPQRMQLVPEQIYQHPPQPRVQNALQGHILQAPQQNNMHLPQQNNIHLPQQSVMHVPQQNIMQIPQQNVMHLPQQNIMHVPQQNNMHIHQQNVMQTPQQNVMHLPQQNVQHQAVIPLRNYQPPEPPRARMTIAPTAMAWQPVENVAARDRYFLAVQQYYNPAADPRYQHAWAALAPPRATITPNLQQTPQVQASHQNASAPAAQRAL